jgi:PAS domain S-box-containing protein
MTSTNSQNSDAVPVNPKRVTQLFHQQHQNIIRHTDQMFAWIMIFQWVFAVGLALWLAPLAWNGTASRIHPHIWLALCLGGLITGLPVWLAWKHPGTVLTRHTIAVGQMLMSSLLIHLTGGRIETHFHVFGSLAILAFYRDWRVLVSATAVVSVDHLLRGGLWPESVYGVASASIWRSFEHAGWVLFEVTFLIIAILKSRSEMLIVAERQANLEAVNATIERNVVDRTLVLLDEIDGHLKTEAKLRASEAQLAEALQLAQLGSWDWDISNDSVTWSEEKRRLYGYPAGENGFTLEKSLEKIHPDDIARVKGVIDEALRNHKPFICDYRVIPVEGTVRIVQGRGKVILNDQKQPVRMLGVVQDITETKQVEEALRQSEER